MSHTISDDDERAVTDALIRARRVANEVFKSTDPLLIMEIHDRLIARAHCCDRERGEDSEDWK